MLAAGVRSVHGDFEAGDAVEVVDPGGRPFAKGLVGAGAAVLTGHAGRHSSELPPGTAREVIHRDDLVVIPH